MNRDDIIRMAREAGIGVKEDLEDWHVPVWHLGIDYLERFAALVAAVEREACAKVLDEMADDMAREMEPRTAIAYVRSKAALIRARGENT